MVVINKEVLTSALGIMKIIMGAFGLIISSVIGSLAGKGFAKDRFNFIVAFGVMVMIWCFVSFLLYLCDCVTKSKPETMRIIEMAVAIFLVLLGLQAFVYATESAVHFANVAKAIEAALKKNGKLVFEGIPDYCPKPTGAAVTLNENQPWVNVWNTDAKENSAKYSDLSAATSFFCIATVILFAVIIFIAYKRGVPGTPHVEPAHVAN